MMHFKIIQPQSEEEKQQYYQLRYEVLRKPWNRPHHSTFDDTENTSEHFLMLDDLNNAAVTGRLQFNSESEAQIRSMAVRHDLHGMGLGKKMIAHLEKICADKKIQTIVLDARENAVGFYEQCGYEVREKSYLLFNTIQHFKMDKKLS